VVSIRQLENLFRDNHDGGEAARVGGTLAIAKRLSLIPAPVVVFESAVSPLKLEFRSTSGEWEHISLGRSPINI